MAQARPGMAVEEIQHRSELDHRKIMARPTLFGLWDLATVDRYGRDVERPLKESGAAAEFRLLIDLRSHGVQPREVAAELQGRLTRGVGHASSIAVLVSVSLLHRLQAQRLGSHVKASFFADESEALAWLAAA